MKTPDEIKKGLEKCSAGGSVCDGCEFSNGNAEKWRKLMGDSLAYIQRLEEANQNFVNIIHTLAEQVTKWISVEERLPEGEALAVNDCGTMMVGRIEYHTYDRESMYVCNDPDSGIGISYVTHWIQLPEPPKEDDV